jgi:purine-binding chemotaxis protein CheW
MDEQREATQETKARGEMGINEEAIHETETLGAISGGLSKNAPGKGFLAANVAPGVKQTGNPVKKFEGGSLRVVVFNLAGHEHGVDVRRVREIILEPRISTVIEAPDFVDGVLELRGKIVPVIDLRKRLQLAHVRKPDEASVIIIVQLGKKMAGFGVDSVSELMTVPNDLIQPPTEIVGGIGSNFIDGLAYVNQRLLVILNLDAMLSLDEKRQLEEEGLGVGAEDWKEESNDIRELTFKRIITFELDRETYGAEIGEVAEIMEMAPIMPLPRVPAFILGLVNLRGAIVPIIDLRVRFGLDQKAWSRDSRIIIMKEKNLLVGVAVDSMWESLKLPEDSFQPPPQGVAKIDAEYFKEVCSVKGRMVCVLDIKKILSDTAAKSALGSLGSIA